MRVYFFLGMHFINKKPRGHTAHLSHIGPKDDLCQFSLIKIGSVVLEKKYKM
jgi:hypothetical protein